MQTRSFLATAALLAVALATVFMEPAQPFQAHAAASNFTITITPGPECYDGQDNDQDGLIDYPDDDDCDSISDPTEGIPPPPSTPPSSAGPQPSGGTGLVIEPSTSVVFSGYAYPGSQVTLLRDAQRVAFTTTGSDARFYMALTGLSPGNYLFLLYAESTAGRRSVLHPFPLQVQKGSLTSIAGVVLTPTIALDKQTVRAGGTLGIYGDTAPGASLAATLLPGGQQIYALRASQDGVHNYQFNTQGLAHGEYILKLSASVDGFQSGFGMGQSFIVGSLDQAAPEPGACGKGDLNCDGFVDLVDFSIAAYWYGRQLNTELVTREQTALNGDGEIGLIDFSIMAYYWTG